ncbi:MAG TPA: SLBB domain-containing protein, partial [bacterium]|nr:SLBB domain-containing protein [bacterium]
GTKASKQGTRATREYFDDGRASQVAALPAELQPGQRFTLSGGEMIRMARIEDVVYLTGAWARPGQYTYRPDWTIFDYIGQAGGFFPGAQEGEARWIRKQGPGLPPIVQHISLKDIMQGGAPMPELRPEDMIYIPTKNNQWNGPTLLQTLLNFGTQIRFFTQ